MTATAHAAQHVAGLWWKVITAAVIAGLLAGGSAVVITAVNSSRIERTEDEVRDLDERQRQLTRDVVGLKSDVRYSRDALDRLLWHQGIPLPVEDDQSFVQSPEGVVDSSSNP